jgi:hypothetical protein
MEKKKEEIFHFLSVCSSSHFLSSLLDVDQTTTTPLATAGRLSPTLSAQPLLSIPGNESLLNPLFSILGDRNFDMNFRDKFLEFFLVFWEILID